MTYADTSAELPPSPVKLLPPAGLLNVCKPPGMTSHEVVGYLRRLTGANRVGHAGTLDPGAAGVLVVAVGTATRLLEYLEPFRKTYCGEIVFGCETYSQDAESEVVRAGTTESPASVEVEEAFASFVGEIEQVPPMVSAVKYRGKPLYRYARRGQQVQRRPRRVTVERFDLVEYDPGPPGVGRFRVTCSTGTYVRTLCTEVGRRLGVPAHLGFLVRTAVGPFSLLKAQTLEELTKAHARGNLPDRILPVTRATCHLGAVTVAGHYVRRLQNGNPVPASPHDTSQPTPEKPVRALTPEGTLLAVGRWEPATGVFHPHKVLQTGEPN